MEIFCCWQ